MRRLVVLTFILACLSSAIAAQSVTDSVRLTAVGAPWDVVIEGSGLNVKEVRTKPDGAYFLLFPNGDELNISLYIEPAAKCKSAEQCREFVLNAGNPAWGKFESLQKSNIGMFSVFEFYRPEVLQMPLQMQDMYAQYVDKGYWVDLHLSKVAYKKDDRKLFEKLLGSVKLVDKGAKVDSTTSAITSTTSSWLKLWDSNKCKETYTALTSISREKVNEDQWTEYCLKMQTSNGKISSRELIAVSTTSSLPSYPDRAAASLRFQSIIGSQAVIEMVTLTTEKDRSWTVSHYMVLQ